MTRFLKQVGEEQFQALKTRLDAISGLSSDFLILLCGSTLIATLGLFQNSPAVIIGAMIIAPLMRPLVALSLATLTGESRLLGRATLTLAVGSLAGLCISACMALLFRSLELTPEILGRTHPTLLDLGVAIFAGAIGAYCQSEPKLADSLAGVAISVALVPPLSVVGIGLAFNSMPVWSGAALLYITNLIGITVAGSLVFLISGFIPLHQAKRGLLISGCVSLLLIVPLAFSMRELVLENQISSKIKQLLKEKTFTFKSLQLSSVKVERFRKPMVVTATVLAPEQPINTHQVAMVEKFLSRELHIPMKFRLRLIPAVEIGSDDISATEEAVPLPETPALSPTVENAPADPQTDENKQVDEKPLAVPPLEKSVEKPVESQETQPK